MSVDTASDAAARARLPDLDVEGIMELIPHRYPFLLIDRVVDQVAFESATGIKNVTMSEPWFQGHFPQKPIMPGVLVIEAMAQTAATLVVNSMGEGAEGRLVYFMTIDSARFRRPVRPGDTMHVEVVRQHSRKNVYRFNGVARVDGRVMAEATFAAMIVEPE